MKFIKRPIIIDAIQWTGNTNLSDVEKFIGCKLRVEIESETAYLAGKGKPLFNIFIDTLEGEMKASPLDWIIKGVKGEFYPCKPDIFEASYMEYDYTSKLVPDSGLRIPMPKVKPPRFIGTEPKERE